MSIAGWILVGVFAGGAAAVAALLAYLARDFKRWLVLTDEL